MGKYGYDDEIAKLIPQDKVEEYRICSVESDLGKVFNQYMEDIVSKMLLAKNVALSQDKTKILADNIREKENQREGDEKLVENYLASHLAEKDGKVIDNIEDMREYVREKFLFVLDDGDSENAWIHSEKGGRNVLSVSKKMLDFAKNSSQLEGIVAHELGHFFVNEIYDKARNGNVNETLADKHGLDMLYYMGKNPDEYRVVLEDVLGLSKLNDMDAILLGVADEHGSPKSRLQAVENYEEIKYGDYIEGFEEDESKVLKTAEDDKKFQEFKEKLNESYDEGKYVGFLEAKFMDDDKFKDKIVDGRVDWAQVSYDETLDKLYQLLGDDNFKYATRLCEAGRILGKTNGSGVEVSEKLEKKASQFFMRATNSVYMNAKGRGGSSLKDDAIEKAFSDIEKNDYPNNLSRVLIDEANNEGKELGALELCYKMKEIVEENGVVLDGDIKKILYNGKDVGVGSYSELKLMALGLDGDEKVLSDEIKDKRAMFLNYSSFDISSTLDRDERDAFISGSDELAFGLSYPELNLEEYNNEWAKFSNEKQQNEVEEKFLGKVLEAKTVRLEVPYMFKDGKGRLESIRDGEGTFGVSSTNFLMYSSLALKLPEFVMPKKEEAVGQKLPWAQVLENSDNKKETLLALRQLGIGVDEGVILSEAKCVDTKSYKPKKFGEIISKLKFEGEEYEFMADKEGNIIAVGEEAKRLRFEKVNGDENERNKHISANFREKMEVFDKLIVLSEYQKKEGPRSNEETERASLALNYLMRKENLVEFLPCSGLGNFEFRSFRMRQDGLDYEKMGNDEERINRDFEVLKKTKLYQSYGKDDGGDLSIEEKKKKICECMRFNMGDKTSKMMDDLSGIMKRLIETRGGDKRDVYDIAMGISRVKTGSEDEDKNVSKVVLKVLDSVIDTDGGKKSTISLPMDTPKIYADEKIGLFEKVREENGFAETKGNPDKVFENLSKKSQDEKVKGASLAIVCFSSENFMPEYEVLRYINDKENPKLDLVKFMEVFPKLERGIGQTEVISSEFKDKLSDYMLNGGFKELSFYEQKEVFDMMCHKEMFSDKDGLGKVAFLEELKKSYQKLPEHEKEEASLLMLKDRKFEYEAYNKGFGGEYRVSQKENVVSAMAYAPIRNYFVEEYTDRIVQRIGKEPVEGDKKEDGSRVKEEEVKKYQNQVVSFMNMVNRDMAVGDVKDKLFEVFADKIEAQRETAEKFEVAVKHQDNDRDLGFRNEASARVISSLNQFLDICPDANMEMVDFLTKPYSKESALSFKENCFNELVEVFPKIMASQSGQEEKPMSERDKKEIKGMFDGVSNEDLEILHADFWDKGLEERAMVAQRFLENYAKDNVGRMVDVVVSKYIDKDEPYEKETKDVLKTLYKSGIGRGHYRKDKARFMLGAMLSAKEPKLGEDKGQKMGVGEALAQFCSSNGPAWVKFGQALSNVNGLPDDIRRPMAVLKDNAVKKKRWEIFQELRENVGEEKLGTIRKVGKLLGAGSFFSSLAVEFEGGEKNVLQMMRPRAKEDADSEFRKIKRTVRDLAKKDSMYAVLGTIVERADESTKTEVDIKKGYEQYVEAHKSYNAIESLEVNGVKFNINLCPWTDWSYDEKTGAGFKAMEFGEGKSLPKLDCSEDEKKIIATGYVATELSVLLSGRAWDIDRHSGQQNFDVKRDEKGNIKEVDVNIFDTGALRKPPTEEEKLMIANFYASVVRASVKGENISEVMFEEVEKLEKRGVDASYVSDVQRGSIALSDIVEYQKEEKDNNGKVVKKSKCLSQDDFVEVFGAVVNSGVVDHKIMDNMVKGIIKDKELLAKIAMQKIKGKVKDFMGIGEKKDAVKVKLVGKSTLQRKRENELIDDKFLNTEDNPFKMKEKSAKMSKEEKKEKKDNKFVRNLEAWYLKKNRG